MKCVYICFADSQGGSLMTNLLYYGDNLEIMRRYVPDESVDLVYLDPPFNSQASYNVLFAEASGRRSAAQIRAFEDTWRWDEAAEITYREIVEEGAPKLSQLVQALRQFLGESDMMSYLVMMAPRLVELRRTLKPTGSIYLHCDPTASHYLKLLMDAIFGPSCFRNELVWKRSTPKGHAFTRFPSTHDVLLFYGRADRGIWNTQYVPHDPAYVKSHYSRVEPETGLKYRLDNCLNPNPDRPNLTYEWNGHNRVWRWTKEKMQQLHDAGRLVYSRSGMPQYKRYLVEMPGTPVTSVWTDIHPVNSQAAERLGYPTQKPESLLERILLASSKEGDVVLDPFCGCGTAVVTAEKLRRRWIGIDITHLAIGLIRRRLIDTFGADLQPYQVIGEPTDLESANALAVQDRFQFQCWALGLLGARTAAPGEIKGKDRGIDGLLFFFDDRSDQPKKVVLQVKSGNVSSRDVRDLVGVVEREKAAIAALITLRAPTKDMVTEALSAGYYEWAPMGGEPKRYPRIQLFTVMELLEGLRLEMPPRADGTFRRAPRRHKTAQQLRLDELAMG